MAVKKKEDEKDAQIKALKEENKELSERNESLEDEINDSGGMIGELAMDILDIHNSLADLYSRVDRVVDRYKIGRRNKVERGFVPRDTI